MAFHQYNFKKREIFFLGGGSKGGEGRGERGGDGGASNSVTFISLAENKVNVTRDILEFQEASFECN